MIRDPPFSTNFPVTLMMKLSPATPLSVTTAPFRTTSPTQTTVGAVPPPVALMVVELLMLVRLTVHVWLAASADAAMAALISALRSWPVSTLPTVPEPLLEKVAPAARRTSPVTNSLPVIERCPLGPMQMSPTMPPGGPVMSTFEPSSSRTVQSVAAPTIVFAQSLVDWMPLWLWSHAPCPLQPAVVHALPSLSAHGVLFDANMCVCTHTPSSGLVPLTSQPAVVHVFPSVSVHGVLACGVHSPLVVSQPLLHSSARGQTLLLWFWSHTPCPSQPAVVHALPSLSAHGVLFSANRCVCTHTPTLDATAAGFVTPGISLSSHPAVVHVLPSVSAHGVLTSAA